MSRGWENKSVQGMMDDHDNRPKRKEPEKSEAQLAFEKKLHALELSRKGVLNDLARASHPRHQEQLQSALRHLDERIALLREKPDDEADPGKDAAE